MRDDVFRDIRTYPDKETIRKTAKAWRDYTPCADRSPDLVIGLASTFTDAGIVDYLGGLLIEAGSSSPEVRSADYNQIVRACLSHHEVFGERTPDLIAVAFRLEDLSTSSETTTISNAAEALIAAIATLRSKFDGVIVVSLPPRPRSSTDDLVGFSRASASEMLWRRICIRIDELAHSHARLYTVDLEKMVSLLGEDQCLNARNEMLYRQPFTPKFQFLVAEHILRIHFAQKKEPKKCLVLDCDNTLWGGIIGEEGLNGVDLSDDFPGRPYREFQRQLKAMRDAGVFLAICSKNNHADVEEMFNSHSGMQLSKGDISAWQVNWEPKSRNLAAIAKALNIGLDSLVFVDDNPFEIEEVSLNAPGVTCLLLPEDPTEICSLLKNAGRLFDRVDITNEDRERVAMASQERARVELAQNLDQETYLARLNLSVKIISPSEGEVARIAQLTNKTNQFNATTKRYTAQEISALLRAPETEVFCVSVSDIFGDYGIVGVVVMKHEGELSAFDTLLLSCRVLARGVETALIKYGVKRARLRGAQSIVGEIVHTKKNGMVADLFLKHGFEEVSSDSERSSFIRSTDEVSAPPYLTIMEPENRDHR